MPIHNIDPIPVAIPNQMTQKQAKDALVEGKKVTHWLFSDSEFIFIDEGVLKDEKGYTLNWREFWMTRQDKNFLENWTEYKTK